MARRTIVVLDPTSQGHPEERPLAARPESLEGKRLGFLWNGKPNADVYLSEVRKLLTQRYRPASVRSWSKPRASATAFEGLLEEIAQGCDVVVNGVGDWGSCASWSVHDSTQFEARGVPVATVCTEEFGALGRDEARGLGYPGLPVVLIPHPLGDRPVAWIKEIALKSLEEIVRVLTAPAPLLAQEYRERYPSPKGVVRAKPLFG